MIIKDKSGKFIRTRIIWKPEEWDNGYLDNRGRMRVYRPDYPKAYHEGYALRAHVVWWLFNHSIPQKGDVLHHINKIKDDDHIENLQLISRSEHTILHCKLKGNLLICEHCKKQFYIATYKIKQKISENNYPRFCSQKCYHAHGKSKQTRNKISNSLKISYKEGKHKRRFK